MSERETYLRRRLSEVTNPLEWLIEADLLREERLEREKEAKHAAQDRAHFLEVWLRGELGIGANAPLPVESDECPTCGSPIRSMRQTSGVLYGNDAHFLRTYWPSIKSCRDSWHKGDENQPWLIHRGTLALALSGVPTARVAAWRPDHDL